MADEFLTVAEIAETLKVNQQTIRNWIERGELAAVRVGQRRVRIRQSDLDRFLETTAAGGPGSPVDEAVYEAVRDAADQSVEQVRKALGPYSAAQAQEIIGTVLADYVTELNRALAASEAPWGLDGAAFMRRYDVLWSAKLGLGKRGGR